MPPARALPSDLEEILENASFGLAVTDADGLEVYANRQAGLHRLSGDEATVREMRFATQTGDRSFNVSLWLDAEALPDLDEEIFRLAFFDELTGLPNKTLLGRMVGAELQTHADRQAALFLIDLDGLGRTNDYYGAAFTNLLIAAFSERMSSCVRSCDVLGYLANGMFCIFVTDLEDLDISDYANQLLARAKEPFLIQGIETFSSASIGISLFVEDGADFETLLVSADQALRAAKSESKGRIGYKPTASALRGTTDMSIEQRLRTALRDQKLCCVYQPKVSLRDNTVVGVETLLRWRDDDGKLQALGDFVNLATDAGIIDAVSEHVAHEVMDSLPRIDAVFAPSISISLNITAHQASSQVFTRNLLDLLTSYHRPERFILEITEEAFLNGELLSKNTLPMLREAGVKLSIDDFGVGYSSLSALAAVTADELKIDRSFVQNVHCRPRSQSVLKTIESLGHALDMKLVIEGVETLEEVEYLKQNTAIDVAQGYYFSKPFALEEFVDTSDLLPSGRTREQARTHAPARTSGNRSSR